MGKDIKSAGRPSTKDKKLSKQLVLETALLLLSDGGVDAVSFRKLAAFLNATPMAIKYHVGSKKELLGSLVETSFRGIADGIEGRTPQERLRNALLVYCSVAIEHASLVRCMLGDTSLMSKDIMQLTENLRQDARHLNNGDENDVMLNLLVDYTHGFVFAAASASPENYPAIEVYLRSLDWMLETVSK